MRGSGDAGGAAASTSATTTPTTVESKGRLNATEKRGEESPNQKPA